jgi:hypothetical protein
MLSLLLWAQQQKRLVPVFQERLEQLVATNLEEQN